MLGHLLPDTKLMAIVPHVPVGGNGTKAVQEGLQECYDKVKSTGSRLRKPSLSLDSSLLDSSQST
jgi:hypothetical protein